MNYRLLVRGFVRPPGGSVYVEINRRATAIVSILGCAHSEATARCPITTQTMRLIGKALRVRPARQTGDPHTVRKRLVAHYPKNQVHRFIYSLPEDIEYRGAVL